MATAELETLPAEQTAKTGTGLAIIDYGVNRELLEKQVAEDLKLAIVSIDDKAGFERVNTRRKELVTVRTGIDKKEKELTAPAKLRVKQIKEVADELREIAGRSEDHCANLCDWYKDENERIKRDAADKFYNTRDAQLRHVGIELDRIVVESLTDAQIDQRINEAVELAALRQAEVERQAAAESERQRVAAEEAARVKSAADKLAADQAEFTRQTAEHEAERQRRQQADDDARAAERAEWQRQRDEENAKLIAERAERDRQAAELQAEKDLFAAEQRAAQAKIDDEQQRQADETASQRLAAEQSERDRLAAIELENHKAAAAEQARIETEQRLAREAAEKQAAVELAAKEAARIEAERPYRDQLLRLADSVEAIGVPNGPKTSEVKKVLEYTADEIRAIAKKK